LTFLAEVFVTVRNWTIELARAITDLRAERSASID
jgi:hypothetical protein